MRQGADYFKRSRNAPGDTRELYLLLSFLSFRMALTEAPGHAATVYNIGVVYEEIGKPEIAFYYYEHSLRLDKDHIQAAVALGKHYEKSGDIEKARKYFLTALQSRGDDPEGKCDCAYWLARLAALGATKDPVESAYFSRWSMALNTKGRELLGNWSMFNYGIQNLNLKQVEVFEKMKDEFSIRDLEVFRAIQGPAVPERPKARDHPVQEKISELGANGVNIKLTSPVVDMRPSDGGRRLILRTVQPDELLVVDLVQAKLEKELPLAEASCLFAAGGNVLVVWSNTARELVEYAVPSLEILRKVPIRFHGYVDSMEMGLNNSDRAFLSFSLPEPHQQKREYAFLHLNKVIVAPFLSDENLFSERDMRHRVQIRADSLFQRFLIWNSFSNQPIYDLLFVSELAQRFKIAEDLDCLMIDSDGDVYLSSQGKTFEVDGKERSHPPDLTVIPEHGYFLNGKFFNGEIPEPPTLYFPIHGSVHYGALAPVRSSKFIKPGEAALVILHGRSGEELERKSIPLRMKDLSPVEHDAEPLPLDRRIWASANARRLAIVDNHLPALQIFGLDLTPYPEPKREPEITKSEEMRKTGDAVLTAEIPLPAKRVTTGNWSHELNIPAGSAVTIEDGPKGVAYDADHKILRLDRQTISEEEQHTILIHIKAPDGKESYQKIEVP